MPELDFFFVAFTKHKNGKTNFNSKCNGFGPEKKQQDVADVNSFSYFGSETLRMPAFRLLVMDCRTNSQQ